MAICVKLNHFNHDKTISDIAAWDWILPSAFMLERGGSGAVSKAYILWKQCKYRNHTYRLHITKEYLTKSRGQRPKSPGYQVAFTLKWMDVALSCFGVSGWNKLNCWANFGVCCYGNQHLVSLSVSMMTGDRNWQPFRMVTELGDTLDFATES